MTGADNNPCRLCGGKSHQIILDDIITRYNDRFALNQCDGCALVSTYPSPPDKMLQQYYDHDYWQSGQSNNSTSLDTLYRLRMTPIISAIRKYTTDGSKILDWGCGDGSFIKLLRSFGLHCFGIDTYKKDLNDPLISSTTIEKADFPDGYFDIM